ncbi:hypothetical protein K457DRAFT_21021 [Linnemannia elongata AG-77]|uniref:Uncharacterized protein n=1 Tax=Linnemannia elongata AG-77 TaxID=1314771 RepID=A0A197JR76_9FUNG|nr:hypothetical protein K457DRAFT_21021 [Linnemannia elongata AG-77]
MDYRGLVPVTQPSHCHRSRHQATIPGAIPKDPPAWTTSKPPPRRIGTMLTMAYSGLASLDLDTKFTATLDKVLLMMEFAYNNSVDPSTGVSPFLLNQGLHPLVPASLVIPTTTSAPAVTNFIQQQSSVLALAQDAIAHAQLQ